MKKNVFSKQTKENVVSLYKSGLSMAKISKNTNIGVKYIFEILHETETPIRTKGGIYPLNEQEILTKYKSGISASELATEYSVSWSTIINILKKYGQDRNNRYHNLSLNTNYFNKIDTIDKAYFLGFLLTDGNVGKKNNAISLSLKEEDREILETFSKYTGNSNKIHERKSKPEVTWTVKNFEMKRDLAQYGVVPQKTDKTFLPILPEELMPHLIRGMIDGDGSISFRSHYIYFCGNYTCVEQLRDYLVNKLGVFSPKIIHPEPNLWSCQWSSQKDIMTIGNYIYKDKKDCFLKRKYNNFLIIQGNTEVIN